MSCFVIESDNILLTTLEIDFFKFFRTQLNQKLSKKIGNLSQISL